MQPWKTMDSADPAPVTRRNAVWEFFVGEWRAAGMEITATVAGKSMGHTLPEGTCVRIRLASRPPFQKRDIVCIRRNGHFVLHRLLFCIGPVCVEKGDGNRYPGLCWRRDIVGLYLGRGSEQSTGPPRLTV